MRSFVDDLATVSDGGIRLVVGIVEFPDVPWLLTRLPPAQRIAQDALLQVGVMWQAQAIAQRKADGMDGAWRTHLA